MKWAVHIEQDSAKIINTNMQAAKPKKLNSVTHREDHLRQQAGEYQINDNTN